MATGDDCVRAKEVTGSKSGYGFTKILVKHADVMEEDVVRVPDIMRDYGPLPQNAVHEGRTWVVERPDGRQLVVGESLQDGRGILATVHLRDEGRPPLAFSQKKKLRNPSDGFFAPTEDTVGSLSLQEIRSPQSRVSILSVDGEAVKKFDDLAPDFSAPEPEPVINPPALEDAARMERDAVSSEAGSPLDHNATRLVEEGRVTSEDMAAWAEAQTEIKRVDDLENAGLTVLDRVLNAMGGRK